MRIKRLDVYGKVKIRGGSPNTGKILTCDDTSGLASWTTPGGGGEYPELHSDGKVSYTNIWDDRA